MINVYSSKFSAQPTETYPVTAPTIGAWLTANIKSYKRDMPLPISIVINKQLVPQMHWHDKLIDKGDDVKIVVEPKGTELFFGALFIAATRMMSPKIPKMNNLAASQGQDLDSPAARGNKVKVNDVRPDLAGTYKIYGNYLKPMHRWFAGKRDQKVEMCLDLGVGKIHALASDIFIGDTPITAYGDNAAYKLYMPGQSLAADSRAVWWHDVQEVGSGSNGSSGLEMTESKALTLSYVAYSHRFSANSISIPAGSGSFPADWTAGLVVRVVVPYNYEVVDNAVADIIYGDNLSMLAPTVGKRIEIAGQNAGFYTVRSYTPSSPAIPPTSGSAGYFTGTQTPSTYNFSTTPETFTVKYGTTNYNILIDTNTVDLTGLIAAINTKASNQGAPFEAVAQGTFVRIRDKITPYSGKSVTLASALPLKIFGSSVTTVAGVAYNPGTPAVTANMTLNLPDGTPARSLTLGPVSMAIGNEGMKYNVVTAGTQQLTVERLDHNSQPDPSFPGFVLLDTPSAVISLDPSSLKGGYRGAFAMTPPNEKTDLIEYDVFHPQGLCGIGREGQIYEVKSFHTFEWRDADIGGPWNEVHAEHTGNSMDSMGVTYQVPLPYPMRAEGRIVKRFVSQPGRIDNEKRDDIVWYGCRSRLAGNRTVYPNSTVLCLTIRGGDRLSAESEAQVWVKGTRILPVRRNGAWAPEQPTSEIDAYCLYVLKAAGYTDSQLDLAEWDRLGQFWRDRGDTFNWLFKDSLTVQQVVDKALSCGFSELTVRNGLLTPVRDEPQSFFQALYTTDTQTEDGALDIRFDMPSGDDFDGIDARYMDERIWQIATVKCRTPGAPAAKRVKVIDVEGINNRDKAYQFGMRELQRVKYMRKTCSWATEMAAFNSNYMDYVQVAGEAPGYAESHVMEAYDAAQRIVTVENPITWDDFTPPYFASVRMLDGRCHGPVEVTPVGSDMFRLPAVLPFSPQIGVQGTEPPYVLIGQGYGVQLTDIVPDGTDSARCEARFYTPELYQFDNTQAPADA